MFQLELSGNISLNKLYNCKYLMTASFYLDRRIIFFNAITIFYDLRDYKKCYKKKRKRKKEEKIEI